MANDNLGMSYGDVTEKLSLMGAAADSTVVNVMELQAIAAKPLLAEQTEQFKGMVNLYGEGIATALVQSEAMIDLTSEIQEQMQGHKIAALDQGVALSESTAFQEMLNAAAARHPGIPPEAIASLAEAVRLTDERASLEEQLAQGDITKEAFAERMAEIKEEAKATKTMVADATGEFLKKGKKITKITKESLKALGTQASSTLEILEGLGEGIAQEFGDLIGGFSTSLSDIAPKVKDIGDLLRGGDLKDAVDALSDLFSDIKDIMQGVIDAAKSAATAVGEIPQQADLGTGLAETVARLAEVVSDVKGVMENTAEIISSAASSPVLSSPEMLEVTPSTVPMKGLEEIRRTLQAIAVDASGTTAEARLAKKLLDPEILKANMTAAPGKSVSQVASGPVKLELTVNLDSDRMAQGLFSSLSGLGFTVDV